MKVTVIGAGSWGTALAIKSVIGGNDTYLYCRRAEAATVMRQEGENHAYLPGVALPSDLHISHSLVDCLKGAHIVLMVTPSTHVRETAEAMKPYVKSNMIITVCSKGIERGSGQLLTDVVEEVLGDTGCHIGALSGPNHAEEIGRDLPAASVVACDTMDRARIVCQALHSPTYRLYTSDDIKGIELAAATKNIIALAAGIVDGLALGDNCKSTLLTRGLHEMTRFGMAMGAQKETYVGLAGMGDLMATCMSKHSRNRHAGCELAAGKTADEIRGATNMVVEGFNAVDIVYQLAKAYDVNMPITEALYSVLYQGVTPKEALHGLMMRNIKAEIH